MSHSAKAQKTGIAEKKTKFGKNGKQAEAALSGERASRGKVVHPVKGIDHVFILVNNLGKSAENFRQLGFTLSPRGLHSKAQGTANYTVMFQNDYFELLGIVEETAANRQKKQDLENYGEGLYAIAGRIDNALQAAQNLTELGFGVTEVQNFSRPVDLAGGKQGVAAFSTVAFKKNEVPNGQVFMCEQKTRDMVWRSELMTHENGAIALQSVILLSSEPEKTAKRYARLFKDGKIAENDGEIIVSTGQNSAIIRIVPKEANSRLSSGFEIGKIANHAYAGLGIFVKNLDETKTVLKKNGVTFADRNEKTIVIPPRFASGAIIEFTEK
ncbi:VOC family protein [Bartonella sp. M0187]|uniref:VOC family protein n=1 Tax=Bartonella apihabitans TaxID=2750929 RepID=UPI0018DB15B2|nr:VOC family protein [Bartonella apihabitans]MBI0025230.1 VOC family protein [Bartonella apihabitans]